MREIVLTSEEIQETCKRIAKELEDKFRDNTTIPVFIGVLKGAAPFFTDVLKYYTLPCKIDFIQASSYNGTSSTGVIHLKRDINEDIKGKDVVIVEDIIDTGLTLDNLVKYIKIKHMPRSVTIVALIDKKPLRQVELSCDIVGYQMNENKFLVGYGFDYRELVRNYDYIFVPSQKDLQTWDKLLSKEAKELKK